MVDCPICCTAENVRLDSPDCGKGAVFICNDYRHTDKWGERRYGFIVKGPEAKQASDEALARSAANAALYVDGKFPGEG